MNSRKILKRLTGLIMILLFITLSLDAGVYLGQSWWVVKWGDGSADPFTGTYKNVSGSNPWKNGLIEEVKPYNIIRNMDLNYTNHHYAKDMGVSDPSWNGRIKKGDKFQIPMAYEWQIDLCNRTKSAYWVCVPHKATADYVFNLATLIKEQLDPDLRIFIEWSNEVWNPGFPVHDYCANKAKEIMNNAPWTVYYIKASTESFHQFERVFGKNNPRITKIMGARAATFSTATQIMGLLNGPLAATVNPHGVEIDALACATYFAGVDNNVDGSNKDKWIEHKKIADKYGILLGFYEGGTGSNVNPFSSNMTQLYKNYLADLEDVGFTFGCHYYHSGTRGWATIPKCGIGYTKAMTYPKYKVWTDYCKANPLPPVDQPLAPKPTPIKFSGQQFSAKQNVSGDVKGMYYSLTGRVIKNVRAGKTPQILFNGQKLILR